VRLGQEPATTFAPATIAGFQASTDGRPPRLEVCFLGLLVSNGPLPRHLTEYVRDRLRNADDPTFGRFLDVFNHRMLSLFYRGWSQAQPTVNLDRPEADRFGDYVGSLFGIGMPAYCNRDAIPDLAKRHYAGHLILPDPPCRWIAVDPRGFSQAPGTDRGAGRALVCPPRRSALAIGRVAGHRRPGGKHHRRCPGLGPTIQVPGPHRPPRDPGQGVRQGRCRCLDRALRRTPERLPGGTAGRDRRFPGRRRCSPGRGQRRHGPRPAGRAGGPAAVLRRSYGTGPQRRDRPHRRTR